MRLLPGMAVNGGPLPYDRDARRRGLTLRVGAALPGPPPDPAEIARVARTAEHLEAHGVRDLWLGVTGPPPAEPPLAAAAAIVRSTSSMRVVIGVSAVACSDTHQRVAAARHLMHDRVHMAVVGDGVDPEGVPVAATRQCDRQWRAGGREQAEVAAARGAGWLAIDEGPQEVLHGIVAAEAVADARSTSFPADGIGALLASGLRRGDLAPGQIGATGAASLRTLIERYVAVGVTHFALMPVTDAFEDWVHDICAAVTGLDDIEAVPCGC